MVERTEERETAPSSFSVAIAKFYTIMLGEKYSDFFIMKLIMYSVGYLHFIILIMK